MRILVTPERLLDLSRQMAQEAARLREMEGRLGRALGGLDWAVRQQANVEGQVHDARNRARALAERAEGMSRFLAERAQAFQQADQEAYAGWDSFFMPFRIPTPVPTPTPESGDKIPDLSPELLKTISTWLPPAALTALVALMKVDATGVGHVFGPQWLKELAGASTHLTRIRPENLAKHLLKQEDLFRLSFSPLANFMTVVGLIPTAMEDWHKYSGQGAAAVVGAFLVDATIDIGLSKAFQLGGAALSTALLTPVLGPFAPVAGLAIGSVAGNYAANWLRGTSVRDEMVKTATEGLGVIGSNLHETAEGIQSALSGIFDKVIVPVE